MRSAYGFVDVISSPGPTWHAASIHTTHMHVQARTSLLWEPFAFINLRTYQLVAQALQKLGQTPPVTTHPILARMTRPSVGRRASGFVQVAKRRPITPG